MASEPLTAQVESLLARDGHAPRDVHLVPCNAGGNNRVFEVFVGERRLIAKWYFNHPTDTRDRLGSEYAFLNYARRIGLGGVPAGIACDPILNLALYEYVEGERIEAAKVTQQDVNAALDFFLALNEHRARLEAISLPKASEACFTVSEHLRLVDERIGRLAVIEGREGIGAEARVFVATLKTRWESIKAEVTHTARRHGIELDGQLPPDQRCISPSDFGFHNALRRPSGEICFLDFEYAGWDDPAKMVGDFFSHPANLVDPGYSGDFLTGAMSFCGEPNALLARAELLFPVFQVKWCCIILNDFLPDSARRRRFADPGFNELERKRTQLAKAIRLFESIGESLIQTR